MYSEEIRTKVREFISRFIRAREFQNNDDIFALGFVNSLFAMQLVLFVESEFGLTIENEDLDLDNFRSVDAITSLVERKTSVLVGV